MCLKEKDWEIRYKSRGGAETRHLVEEFYIPAFKISNKYDRIAGYFNSTSLAIAAEGLREFVDNEGKMRLLVEAKLDEKEREVLVDPERVKEAEKSLGEVLSRNLSEPQDDIQEARLTILAWLLSHGRLEIKIGVPRTSDRGIFHRKLGIFSDEDDHKISFEGSINETAGGWLYNYEGFNVHCSWKLGHKEFTDTSQHDFDEAWNDEDPAVDVYSLPEGVEEDLIDWAPAERKDLDAYIEALKNYTRTGQFRTGYEPDDLAPILEYGGLAPGGIHLAEEASTIYPWPHQRVVSDTLVTTYPNGFLLSDEVGLGKTIETGLTLSRLALTGEIDTALILAPASLVPQWQSELWEKFNVNTYIYDGHRFVDALGHEEEPPSVANLAHASDHAWTKSPVWRFLHSKDSQTVVIASWHLARLHDRQREFAPAEGEIVRTRREIPPSVRGKEGAGREGVWDLVVVDEAHHARRKSLAGSQENTPNNLLELLRTLREHTHCYYLLTATPMQIHPIEIFDLLSLLDLPEEWRDSNQFLEFFETRKALGEAINIVEENESDGSIVQSTLTNDDWAAICDALASELELDGGREEAHWRLLTACSLSRSFGKVFDGYSERVKELVRKSTSSLNERNKMESLLLPEREVFGIVNRGERDTALREVSLGSMKGLLEVFGSSTPIDAFVFRNTRNTLRKYRRIGLLDRNVPERNIENQPYIEMDSETSAVYGRIEKYVTKFYKKAQEAEGTEANALGFVMTTYRQRLTSSVYAITQSLEKRLRSLKKQGRQLELRKQISDEPSEVRQTVLQSLDEISDFTEVADAEDGGQSIIGADITEFVPGETERGKQLLREEIEELESFISDLQSLPTDPKIKRLRDEIRTFRKERSRILIFTQYTDTMDSVREELVKTFGEKVACYSGRGGEIYNTKSENWKGVSKEKVKRLFSDDGHHVDILIGTRSAAEGLNLQKCGVVINYDLPWNPMKVEQRIGRVDRIGQEHDTIEVRNFLYEDTVETDIYDRLIDRIGLFESTVGTMQPILSTVENDIKQATLDDALQRDSSDRQAQVDTITHGIIERTQMAEEESIDLGDEITEITGYKEGILRQARNPAWSSLQHPDISEIGALPSSKVPFDSESAENILINSSILESSGINFERVSNIDSVDLDEERWEKKTYRLTIPPSFSIPVRSQSGTIAQKIATGENAVGVTFSDECADEYPSLRYLVQGDPLFERIVSEITSKGTSSLRVLRYGEGPENSDCVQADNEPWTVCDWLDKESRIRLVGEKEKKEKEGIGLLANWCDQFSQMRKKSIYKLTSRLPDS